MMMTVYFESFVGSSQAGDPCGVLYEYALADERFLEHLHCARGEGNSTLTVGASDKSPGRSGATADH